MIREVTTREVVMSDGTRIPLPPQTRIVELDDPDPIVMLNWSRSQGSFLRYSDDTETAQAVVEGLTGNPSLPLTNRKQ